GLEEMTLAQEAAGLALDYLKETQLGALGHLRRIALLSGDTWMVLDNATRRNLELVQSLRDGSPRGPLLGLLDETRTGAGPPLHRARAGYGARAPRPGAGLPAGTRGCPRRRSTGYFE